MSNKPIPNAPKSRTQKPTTNHDSQLAADLIAMQARLDAVTKANADGWANAMAGLAGVRDKKTATTFENQAVISDAELDAIYLSDGVGAKIVNVVADDMTREWLDLESDENDDDAVDETSKKQLIAIQEALNIQECFNEALKWARLYGGALIIIGAQDGEPLDKPFDPKRVKKSGAIGSMLKSFFGSNTVEGLGKLTVVDKRRIRLGTSQFQTDITKPNYGAVELYDVEFYAGGTSTYQRVHASRCLVFKGEKLPLGMRNLVNVEQRYWGVSVLQQIHNELKDYGGLMGSVASLMYEFTIGKYKISNLVELLAQGREDELITRMEIVNMAKSILNAVLLGEGEEYSRDSVALGGIAEIIGEFKVRLSGSSGIPTNKLFSEQRTGLNADGKVDDNYYDTCRSQQQQKITPPLKQLYGMIEIVYGIKCQPIKYQSLKSLDPKAEAETTKLNEEAAKTRADKYGVYLDHQVLTPDQVYELEWADSVLGAMPEPGLPPVPEPGAENA